MCLNPPKIMNLLKDSLNLSKTETNLLWTLWELKGTNYKSTMNSRTNPDEENVFVNTSEIHHGVSVSELQQLLNLSQATIQLSLSSLLEKEYVDRKRVKKAYRYFPTKKAFTHFKKQLVQYYEDLGNFVEPFVNSSTSVSALRKIRSKVSEFWRIQGWQAIGGYEDFIVRKDQVQSSLTSHELSLIQQDFLGNNLTPEVSQFQVGDSLLIKSTNSYTSPFHLESNIIAGLWVIQNSNGKKQSSKDSYMVKLTGVKDD